MRSNRVAVDVGELERVPPTTLEYLGVIDFNVYVLNPRGRPTLFCNRDHRPTPAEWAALRRQSASLYIRSQERDQWRRQVAASLEQLIASDEIPPMRQFEFLQAELDDTLRASLPSPDLARTVQQSQEFGRRLVTVLTRELAAGDLFGILRHDFDTFSHVVNVASYCVLLASEWGVRDRDELERIVVGGLLHDIGKRYIPLHVLNKPGPLTPAEREIIERHPQQGYVDLRKREELEFGQLMMVYQHHERLDGSGYPVGITAQEIHPWAKLCAVCDVFEALTAARPYRKPMPISVALAYLADHAGTYFDQELVQCWKSAVKRSPLTLSGPNLSAARP